MARQLIVVVALLVSASAVAALPKDRNRPATEAERAFMHRLACTCGTCEKEPIDECGCGQAAQMRGEVQAQLAGRDLSTAAGRAAAWTAVRAAMVATWGEGVLEPRPDAKEDPRLGWLPLIVFVGGFVLLVVVTRRSLARRRQEKRDAP